MFRHKYPKLRELKEAIRSLLSRAYTSNFPRQPHKPYERFRGKPEFHQEDCIGCTACAQVCPAKAIEIEDSKNKRRLTIHWDICISCGQCQANCPPEKGIILSQEFDLATTEDRRELQQSIEKEMVVCDCCGEPIVPYDQIIWVARRLGPLIFTNTSLMLFYLTHLDLAIKEAPLQKIEPGLLRSDRIGILCPRCRREAVLKS